MARINQIEYLFEAISSFIVVLLLRYLAYFSEYLSSTEPITIDWKKYFEELRSSIVYENILLFNE